MIDQYIVLYQQTWVGRNPFKITVSTQEVFVCANAQ